MVFVLPERVVITSFIILLIVADRNILLMAIMKRSSSVLTLLLLKTLAIGMIDMEIGFASAFSPPGPARPSEKIYTTERGYGHHIDVDVPLAVRSPVLAKFNPGFAADKKTDKFTTVSLNKNSAKSKKSKRRSHERMVRPKSLNSSSSKIESAYMPTKKSKYPDLLTREEEGRLANSIRALRSVIRIRDALVADHCNPVDCEIQWQPSETEWAVACGLSVRQLRRVMHEGQEARAKLVDANGGLVHAIAKKHYYSVKHANQAGGGLGSILTLQDMVQEGNLGLMEAAERFEPERGFRFSTYATWWVRQRILRSISEYSRVIRLPAHGKYSTTLPVLLDAFSKV